MPRYVKPWVGKTDDTPAPLRVQLRILEAQGGKCAITGHKFRPGDKKRLDHIKPIIDGGWNGEGNLQWILDAPHKEKTKAEATVRAKVRKLAKTHAGIKHDSMRPPLISRNSLKTDKERKKKLPMTSMPTELERRYGIRAPEKRRRK